MSIRILIRNLKSPRDTFGTKMMNFKRIKLSESSTKKLQLFKTRTGLTPNIACRIALGISLSQKSAPPLELYTEESGQEINRYTLLGEHDQVLISLFSQWCHEQGVEENKHYEYFIAHINNGVELLVNRVKSLSDFTKLLQST